MNDHQRMVRDFMVAMGQPVPDGPTLAEKRVKLRVGLIIEEALEYAEACGLNADAEQVGLLDWEAAIDALCDLLYVTYGAAIEMGIDLDPFFAEVHRANMAKTGGPTREDGKLLKPPGWEPPDIAGVLARVIHEAEARRGYEDQIRDLKETPGVTVEDVPFVKIGAGAAMDPYLPPEPPMVPVMVTNVVDEPTRVMTLEELADYLPPGLRPRDMPPTGIWLVPHPDQHTTQRPHPCPRCEENPCQCCDVCRGPCQGH